MQSGEEFGDDQVFGLFVAGVGEGGELAQQRFQGDALGFAYVGEAQYVAALALVAMLTIGTEPSSGGV